MLKEESVEKLNTGKLAAGGGGKKRAVWALADQGIVSLGNLGTVILVGHQMAPDRFGLFNIILEAIFFLNSLQAAWVVFPLSVRGAASDISRLRRLTASSVVLTCALGIGLGVAMSIAGVSTHHIGPWLWALVAMICWQFQETTRRGLMAHLRFRDAIWGDAISYLLQAAIIAGFVFFPGHPNSARQSLSIEVVFMVIAFTSLAGGVLQLSQIGFGTVKRRHAWAFGKLAWQLGRWIVLGNVVGIATGAAYPWLMGFSHGLEEVALYSALGYLMKLANPLMVSIQGLIIPACAQANSRAGVRAAARVAWRYGMMGLCLLAPYFLLLLVLPDKIMGMVYNKPQYLGHAGTLRIFVLGYSLVYIGNVAASLLNALEQTKSSFVAQTVCTVSAVLVSLPMTYLMGAFGAVFGGMLTNVARVAALAEMLRRAFRVAGPQTGDGGSGKLSDQPTTPHTSAEIVAAEAIATDGGVNMGAA